MGEDRRRGMRDLEDVRGTDWSRATWSEPDDSGDLVLVRQSLTTHGDQEVVWRVPSQRLGELCGLAGAPESDADGLLGWAEEEPERVDALVEALEQMDPPVVDGISLG
ncbi:MAG: hypothetical protein LCI03_11930 [Actinobacteria bacterium]|nr:hypothetical protein [Actinomycetota bacterium]